jgi:CRISPR-associated protein Cas6
VWIEDDATPEASASAQVAERVFRIRGRTLPVEHGLALCLAIEAVLGSLDDEPEVGIHPIHVASSGNGWMRPEAGDDAPLSLSRRTRLVLRLPRSRLEDARRLEGQALDVAGHRLDVGESKPRELRPSETLFARYVAHAPGESEAAFVERAAQVLAGRGMAVRKLLCGQARVLRGNEGALHTRSLMVADLAPGDSIRLQESGLGAGRRLGCGLFVPHKSIAPVRSGNLE